MSPIPRTGVGRAGPARGAGPRLVLALAALTACAAVAFVFAPVRQPEVTYTWSPADGPAVALPLMPYQPVRLTATVGCAAARAGVRLATVPPRPDPAAAPLSGLVLTGTPDGLAVASAGAALGVVPLPAGDCTLVLTSDATATVVALDGVPVLRADGDVRPHVAGVFAEPPGPGLALTLTADTRFATTPTPLKLAVAACCLVGLATLGAALARADRRAATRRVRLLPAGWWRPRPVDGAVVALLGLWWAVGAGTVDDGYVAGIVRGRGDNGFVGNVYRWLNAPEAPFSWIYEPYHWWALVSAATPWMRLPSTLLGLLCWALLSRLLLPRLGPAGRGRAAPWVAALAFATWWVPFGLGLRPEPWVAVGLVAVFLGVERAVATGRVLPLGVALVAAGATAAVTPGGVTAFAPVLAGAVPLLRLLRSRTDLHLGTAGSGGPRTTTPARAALPLVAVLAAAPASALLLAAADQGAAGLAEAVRVRGTIGGGLPWYQEYERYARLLAPDDVQGAIGRRAAVLSTILAAVGLAWVLATRADSGRPGTPPDGRGPGRAPGFSGIGIAAGPVRRLLVTLVLAAVAMTFSPTKWTQHFGALAGLGAAALAVGLVAFGRGAQRRPATGDPAAARRRTTAGLAGVTVVAGLVLAGQNRWPFVSGWYTPTFSTLPPLVGDVPVATVVVAAGGVVVAALLARSAWERSAGPVALSRPGGDPGRGGRTGVSRATPPTSGDGDVPLPATRTAGGVGRGVPCPAGPLAVVLAAVLALQVLSLVRVAAAHPDGYTPAADLRAVLAGDPCGLQSALLVETDPAAGVLAPVPGSAAPPARPVPVDAGAVPGGATTPGATPWYALDARQRGGVPGALPVVVTVDGTPRPGAEPAVEFARGGRVLARTALAGSAGPADRRLLAPAEADAVRLAVPPGAAPGGMVVSPPRAPVLTPMTRVLPPGTRAVLDWPVALAFPCLRPAPLPPGTAALARWRVAPPPDDASAVITYTPGLGGPLATARLLVTEHRMPTYLRDDLVRDTPQLFRWDPVVPLGTPTPRVHDVVTASFVTHLRVPRLNQEN